VLSGTSHHNGDATIDTAVADLRSIFFTQSIYRCNPKVHVVCEVRLITHAVGWCSWWLGSIPLAFDVACFAAPD
jgi:hypothetical protein